MESEGLEHFFEAPALELDAPKSKRSARPKRQRTPEEQDVLNKKMESLRAKKKQKKSEREEAQRLSESAHRYRPDYYMDPQDVIPDTSYLESPMPPDVLIPTMDDPRNQNLPIPADEGVLVYDPNQPAVFPIPEPSKTLDRKESKANPSFMSYDSVTSGPKQYSPQDIDHIRNTALSIGSPVLGPRSNRKNDDSPHRSLSRDSVSYGSMALRAALGVISLWLSYKGLKSVVEDFVDKASAPNQPMGDDIVCATKNPAKTTVIQRELKPPVFLAKPIQSNF